MSKRRSQKDTVEEVSEPRSTGKEVGPGLGKGIITFFVIFILIFVAIAIYSSIDDDDDDNGDGPGPTPTKKVYNFTMEVAATEYSVKMGYSFSMQFTLHNTGNQNDTYNFTMDIPNGWTPTFNGSFYLLPNATRVVDIDMEVPPSATEGVYNLTVKVESVGKKDVSRTKKLKIAVSGFGVIIEAPTIVLTGSPGNNLTFDFDVKNTGDVNDTVRLTVDDIDIINKGSVTWPQPIITQTHHTLEPTHSGTSSLRVEIPEDANVAQGTSAVIRLRAASVLAENAGVWASDRASFTVLVVSYGIEASGPADPLEIVIGTSRQLKMTITNTGETPAEFDVSAMENVPNHWTIWGKLPGPGFGLTPGQSYDLVFLVNATDQATAGEELAVTYRAFYIANESIVDTYTIKAVAKEASFLMSTDEPSEKPIFPNETATFNFTVTNNVKSAYNITLVLATPPPNNWSLNIIPPVFPLGSLEVVNVSVDLTAPVNASAKEKVEIEIHGMYRSTVVDIINFKIEVGTILNGSVNWSGNPDLIIDPPPDENGSMAEFTIDLTNTGNGGGTFDFVLTKINGVKHNWTINITTVIDGEEVDVFPGDNEVIGYINLKANETGSLVVNILLQPDHDGDDHPMDLVISFASRGERLVLDPIHMQPHL